MLQVLFYKKEQRSSKLSEGQWHFPFAVPVVVLPQANCLLSSRERGSKGFFFAAGFEVFRCFGRVLNFRDGSGGSLGVPVGFFRFRKGYQTPRHIIINRLAGGSPVVHRAELDKPVPNPTKPNQILGIGRVYPMRRSPCELSSN